MQTIKTILKFLLLLIGILVVISFFLPAKVHLERTAKIKAKPVVVYKLISDLSAWERWSPWHRLDPKIELTYSPIREGVGAQYSWKSTHKKVGNGSIKIVDAKPDSYLKTEMNFMDNGLASSEYFITPKGEETEVKWTMDSDAGWNPVGRYFGLFIESMMGKDYERGLHFLDSVAQITPAPAEFTMKLEIGTLPAQKLLLIKAEAKTPEIGQKLGEIYGRLGGIMKENGLEMAGAPMAMYDDPKNGMFTFEAGIPVSSKPKLKLPADVVFREFGMQSAAIAHFYGPYNKTGEAYPALQKMMAEKGKTIAGKPIESYVTDPMTVKNPLEIKTEIYWPIR
jgi:effector-binding domain-containing protein